MSDAFLQARQEMMEDFLNLPHPHNADDVSALWSHNYYSLQDSRGVFAVTDQIQKKEIVGNHNFGSSGYLRCWMGDDRLLLIQNREGARDFRYCSPVFCDTNFASFCETYDAGRDLGAHAAGFEAAVKFLLPISEGTNIWPYLVENAENPHRDKVRATLRAFAAFKLTTPEHFAATGRFVHTRDTHNSDQIADGCLAAMNGPDFKMVRAWIKKHQLWARIVLLRSALIVFRGEAATLEKRYYALLYFLHEEMARIPQFESHVAYRFFALNSKEPFFGRVQRNARDLDRVLAGMAWDLAHWRSLFDLLLVLSSGASFAPFPIPHFMTFDQPFVRLSEGLRLDGLIYSTARRRCEQIPAREFAIQISELLQGECNVFYRREAREDRSRRALDGDRLDEHLLAVERRLTQELADACEDERVGRRLH